MTNRPAKPSDEDTTPKPSRSRKAKSGTSSAEGTRNRAARNAADPPLPYWVTPIGGDIFVVCDYDPATRRYTRNCREVHRKDLPPPFRAEMTRFANALLKHGLS